MATPVLASSTHVTNPEASHIENDYDLVGSIRQQTTNGLHLEQDKVFESLGRLVVREWSLLIQIFRIHGLVALSPGHTSCASLRECR